MQVLLTKTLSGSFAPASEDEADKLRKIKAGATVKADVVQMRNSGYFRKWWALAKIAFDMWSETAPKMEYKGQEVLPDFDRFRRDLTILAGFYHPVFSANGEVRLEAESLKWGSMDEDRFDELYSATINAVLRKIIPKSGYTEATLRAAVDSVMEFA